MKNKELYELTALDYYEEEETVIIFKISGHVMAGIIDRYFDEPAFRAFMRWLESESGSEQNSKKSETVNYGNPEKTDRSHTA